MADKSMCPFMTRPRVATVHSTGQGEHVEAMRIFCPHNDSCQGWSKRYGDCKAFLPATELLADRALTFNEVEKSYLMKCMAAWTTLKGEMKKRKDIGDFPLVLEMMEKMETGISEEMAKECPVK